MIWLFSEASFKEIYKRNRIQQTVTQDESFGLSFYTRFPIVGKDRVFGMRDISVNVKLVFSTKTAIGQGSSSVFEQIVFQL